VESTLDVGMSVRNACLGKPQKQQDEPEVDNLPAEEDDGDDDNGEEEAIQRALEDNPELAAEVGDRYLKKLQACEEKEKGNKAFADKNYEAAVAHFTKCIELDPRDEVYFSNRSAAYASNGKYDEALVDAQAVLRLRPSWVKGHARLAAALYGLEQYGEAKEAYERALKLEPNDQALQRGYEKALAMELKHVREKKHIFKKARGLQGSKVGADFKGSKSEGQQKKEKNKNAKFALSFSDEELEEGGE